MAEDPVMLITGTRKGIGAHLVEHFRAQGAWVGACSRTMDAAEDEQGFSRPVDVTKEDELKAWIREAARRRPSIEVLINNAGAASMNMALLTPTRAARAAIELNYLAAFAASREVAKTMAEKPYP